MGTGSPFFLWTVYQVRKTLMSKVFVISWATLIKKAHWKKAVIQVINVIASLTSASPSVAAATIATIRSDRLTKM